MTAISLSLSYRRDQPLVRETLLPIRAEIEFCRTPQFAIGDWGGCDSGVELPSFVLSIVDAAINHRGDPNFGEAWILEPIEPNL